MKRVIALLLALVLCCGTLAACGKKGEAEPSTTPATPDDGVLRVLIVGHSLGLDSVRMLPGVAKNEGYTDMVIGALYYSGCRLSRHVANSTSETPEYEYHQFDLATDSSWQVTENSSLKFGIEAQDWDLVVFQAGVFEAGAPADDSVNRLDVKDIQTLMDYANANDIDKTTPAKFAWNMTWTTPEKYPEEQLAKPNSQYSKYHKTLTEDFGTSQAMYEAIAATVKDKIAPAYDFQYIFPAGTAMQNAHSSYLNDAMYRDNIHASDFGTLVAAYTWFCTLTDKNVSDMKFGEISYRLRTDKQAISAKQDFVMTEMEQKILVEAVTNALANPYQMTQSQYTEAPVTAS